MADDRSRSLGPVQVASVDVPNINLALAQIQEQLDQLRGLRGVTRVYNRLKVDDPQDADDALTAGVGQQAIHDATTPITADLEVLAQVVTDLALTVGVLQGQVGALETHLEAIVAAVPGAVSVTTVPALANDPATAILLENDLTANWRPPMNSNDAALAAMANSLRTALLAT